MTSPTLTPLHVASRFDNPYTGAELQLLELRRRLKGLREVILWSDVPPHAFYRSHGVEQIRPYSGRMPRGGMLLLGGVHVQVQTWIAHARPERIALLYNLPNHERLFTLMGEIDAATGVEVDVLFASHQLKWSVGLPGEVELSWIDLAEFLALPLERPPRPFTVGRISRDVPGKHHADNIPIYRMLAARGFKVRIMGGLSLAPQLEGVEGIELLAEGAERAADFYATLDAFFYRTGAFSEPYGRVVVEAMASGTPVVAFGSGGYAEAIEPGLSGYLFRTQEEAWDMLMALAESQPLRAQVGREARRRARQLHGPEAGAAALDFYLR